MVTWHLCNSAWYTSPCACKVTFLCSRFFRLSLSNASATSFSPMACLWPSFSLFASCCRICGNVTLQQCFLKLFYLRMLTSKKQFIHTLVIDVIVIFSLVLGPIHEVRFRNELCQLELMSVIFSTAKVLYNISHLSGAAIFQYPVHFPGTCPGLFIDSHNTNPLH